METYWPSIDFFDDMCYNVNIGGVLPGRPVDPVAQDARIGRSMNSPGIFSVLWRHKANLTKGGQCFAQKV